MQIIVACLVAVGSLQGCVVGYVSGGTTGFGMMSRTAPPGFKPVGSRVTGEYCGSAGGLDFVEGYRQALIDALRKAPEANVLADARLTSRETLGGICLGAEGQPGVIP